MIGEHVTAPDVCRRPLLLGQAHPCGLWVHGGRGAIWVGMVTRAGFASTQWDSPFKDVYAPRVVHRHRRKRADDGRCDGLHRNGPTIGGRSQVREHVESDHADLIGSTEHYKGRGEGGVLCVVWLCCVLCKCCVAVLLCLCPCHARAYVHFGEGGDGWKGGSGGPPGNPYLQIPCGLGASITQP